MGGGQGGRGEGKPSPQEGLRHAEGRRILVPFSQFRFCVLDGYRRGAVGFSYSIRILGSSANFSDRFLDQKYERDHLIHFQKCYEYINFSNVQK